MSFTMFILFRILEVVVVAALIIGLIYLIMTLTVKVLARIKEAKKLKVNESDRMYCMDCDKSFLKTTSVKTQVGLYPCPYCAGNRTCEDTLESRTQTE